ncbi:MAG: replicative DNA helicase [Kiritimatiellae bacterium]|nr:replicative DNA helicase [Kiritimatiellia bacterium]
MADRGATAVRKAARADRLLPYNEEAERGVLGSILLDASRVLDLCIEHQIAVESFHVEAHRLVFESMLEMSRDGRPIDVLTVSDRIQSAGKLEQIGGSGFLDRLIDETPTPAYAEYYAEIVRRAALLRTIIGWARETESECFAGEEDADSVLARVEQSFFDITANRYGGPASWPDLVKETMVRIEQVYTTKKGITGIACGFLNLDRYLMGLHPGNMVILAARPGMGKTSLALNVAENIALGRGDPERTQRPVGIFSLEMSREEIVMRMLCSHARVSSFKISGGFISEINHAELVQAADALTKAPLYLDDTPAMEVLDLRSRARRMKKKYGLELIVVDYLQLVHCHEYAKHGRQVEVSEVSHSLKAMAKELHVPVLVLSQLSRAPEMRDKSGKPKLSDLRDSGSIEQDADVVLLLRRPCKYPDDDEHLDKTLAVVDIAKHRSGPTRDNVRLNFDEECTRFTDRREGVDDLEPESFGERQP